MPKPLTISRFTSLPTVATLPNPVHDKIRTTIDAFERAQRISAALEKCYPHRGSKQTVTAFEDGPLADAHMAEWDAHAAADKVMRAAGLRAVKYGGRLYLCVDDVEVEDFGVFGIEGANMLDLDAPAST